MTVAYTTSVPTRISRPATAGPAMVAICMVEVLSATALPKSERGTRFGSSAWLVGMLKARTTPNRAITMKIGSTEVTPVNANTVSSADATAASR